MNAVYDTATSEYMGCYPDGTDPVGVTFEGDAYNTAEYGVHLDGRGDYITIDPLGQPNNYGTYPADTYANDGTFSISFWFWKRKCTVPGGFEWLFSHQDNNQDIYNEASPNAEWTSYPLIIYSEEERRQWINSDPTIADLVCFECDTFPMWVSLDMSHGHRDGDTHRTVESYMNDSTVR